jgi:lysophospholipase L1-like esterase
MMSSRIPFVLLAFALPVAMYATSLLLALFASSPQTVRAVRYLGRVNPSTKELTWPATGVSFTFTGTSARIGLTNFNGNSSVQMVIDGGDPIINTNIRGDMVTPSGLKNGTHTVIFRKRSEAQYGTCSISSVTTDGSFGPDLNVTRQIEFIGDSITAGYGMDGTFPCTSTAQVEDNPKTYAAITADNLKADYSMVVWSGKGLIRNYVTTGVDTSPAMPEIWTRYGANDADNSYTFPADRVPQVVVINLGTNDWSYVVGTTAARPVMKDSDFTAAMVKFVDTILTHYPKAQYFFVSSPSLSDTYPTAADAQKSNQVSAIKAAIAQLNDTSKFHFVDWPTQDGTDIGCDYHPGKSVNAAEALVLTNAISSVMGCKW